MNTQVNGRAANTILHRITVDTAIRRPLWRLWKSRGKQRRELSELMAILSHELRDSLGGMRCAAGILRMDVSAAPDVVKARVLIERQVDHMSRLIEDLMDVSQVENGQLRLQPVRVDLCAIVAQSVQAADLSMVQRNQVESHGGRVTATSAGLGKGSQFTVHLPLPMAPGSLADAGALQS
jgi:signal transduction histidine kinase